ncbi:MAG: MauE/DoxX family redox-associated membrane protein [Chloroflexota bacterium]
MKKLLHSDIINLIFRLLLGLTFLFVSLGKIAEPAGFANEIANYRTAPDWLVNPAAIILPWIELVCGLALAAGVRIRANALLALGMLVVFVLGIISAMAQGLNINCGCYSNIAQQKVGFGKILENLGLSAVALYLIYSKGDKYSADRAARASSPVETAERA